MTREKKKHIWGIFSNSQIQSCFFVRNCWNTGKPSSYPNGWARDDDCPNWNVIQFDKNIILEATTWYAFFQLSDLKLDSLAWHQS